MFACTCVSLGHAWQRHEESLRLRRAAQRRPVGELERSPGRVLNGHAMCSGRGCRQETDGKDRRAGGCDVNVGVQCREKAGGAMPARPVHEFSDLEACYCHEEDRSRTTLRGSVILGGDPLAISIRKFSQMVFRIVAMNQAQRKRGQRSQLRTEAHRVRDVMFIFRRNGTSVRLRLD